MGERDVNNIYTYRHRLVEVSTRSNFGLGRKFGTLEPCGAGRVSDGDKMELDIIVSFCQNFIQADMYADKVSRGNPVETDGREG